MIIFNSFTDDGGGISFTSLLDSVPIRVKIIDPYTGLVAWHTDMLVERGGSYFFSYPRATNYYGFEIVDPDTKKIYLKMNIYSGGYSSIEDFDKLKKLKDFKYSDKDEDLWAAYPLYDIFINRCYDRPNCPVEEGDIVVDIGSNLGLFSYYSILKGAKKVYSFEPGEAQSKAIRDNFSSIENLIIEQKAVSSESGILSFSKHKTKSILSGVFSNPDKNEYDVLECECVNLMDYCKENTIEKINFLKMDCEGSEYRIFRSLTDDFIKNIDKVSMEYHLSSEGDISYIIERLERNGFSVEVSDTSSTLVAYK